MPLGKVLGFTKDVQDLPDKPSSSMTTAQLKAWFDSAPEELRLAFNALIDNLGSVTDGDSGADNIAVTTIAGLTGATVQTVLEALKVYADSKTTNTGNHAGTWQGLSPTSFDSGFQAIELENHKVDEVRHVTAEKQATWNGKQDALAINQKRPIYIQSTAPISPQDGDIWIEV